MAEEKKVTIKLQRLGDKPLKEYVEAVADPAGKPENGSAAALAASLGALAASSAEEGKIDPVVLQELPEMSKYMLKQVEEMVKSRAPLLKRLSEECAPEELESAARVACGIPNEIVYMMCHLAELLEPVAENCSDAMVYNVLGAVHLAQGVIAAMRGEIKAVSNHMMEFTFRYTVNREAEINVQEHQELVDNLIEKLNSRLNKE